MARLTYYSLDEITYPRWHSWVIDYLKDYSSYKVHSEGTSKYREILPQITLLPGQTLKPDVIFKRSIDYKWNVGEFTIHKKYKTYWTNKLDNYMQTLTKKALAQVGNWTGKIYCVSLLPLGMEEQDEFWEQLRRKYRKLNIEYFPSAAILDFKQVRIK